MRALTLAVALAAAMTGCSRTPTETGLVADTSEITIRLPDSMPCGIATIAMQMPAARGGYETTAMGRAYGCAVDTGDEMWFITEHAAVRKLPRSLFRSYEE